MRLAFVGSLLALLLSFGCGDDASTADASLDGGTDGGADAGDIDAGPLSPAPIRVATWNVENLFDEGDDPDTADDVLSAAEVRTKLENIAAVLANLDADFVALEEVENEDLLRRLAEGPAADLGYTAWGLIDSYDGRGIDVGYLSRVTVTGVLSHIGERFPSPDDPDTTYYFTRDAPQVFLDVGGHQLVVTICHFRSQLGDYDDHRYAEAAYVNSLIAQRVRIGQDRQLVVGDLNDEPDSRTLSLILADDVLSDLTLEVPSSYRWTYVYRGDQQQLDFALGTSRVAAETQDVYIYHEDDAEMTSDHAPLYIDLLLQE